MDLELSPINSMTWEPNQLYRIQCVIFKTRLKDLNLEKIALQAKGPSEASAKNLINSPRIIIQGGKNKALNP
jgi:hypothetical protein